MIDKIRSYMAGHAVSEFDKSLVETQISMLDSGQITGDIFKINVNLILQINVDDL